MTLVNTHLLWEIISRAIIRARVKVGKKGVGGEATGRGSRRGHVYYMYICISVRCIYDVQSHRLM